MSYAKKFIIIDWAGNVCFKGKEFQGFEEAWGHLYEFYGDLEEKDFNDQMSEYSVIERG